MNARELLTHRASHVWERYFGSSRGSRIRFSVATGVLAKGALLLSALLVTPLVLRYLGKEGYGLFVTITAVVSWLQLSNLGIGAGLQNSLTEAVAKGSAEQQRALVSTAFFAIIAITAVLCITCGAALAWLPWERVFPASDARLQSQVLPAVAIAVVAFLGGFVLSFVSSIFAAKQDLHISNAVAIVAAAATIVMTLLAMHLDAGLLGITAAMVAPNVVVGWIFAVWYLCRPANQALRPSWHSTSLSAWRRLSSTSAAFFVIQICCVALFQTDYFIIAQLLGPDDVTPYALASKPFAFLAALFASAVSQPLWAGYGNAKAMGDVTWIRRSHTRVRLITMVGYAAVVVIIVATGQTLFGWWVGKEATPATTLILCTGAYYLVRQWTDLHAVLVNGLDMMKPQAISATAHAVVTIALEIILIKRIGLLGVPLGCLAGYLLVSAWFLPWLARSGLRRLNRAAGEQESSYALTSTGSELYR